MTNNDIFKEYLERHKEKYRCECGRIFTPAITEYQCPRCGTHIKEGSNDRLTK